MIGVDAPTAHELTVTQPLTPARAFTGVVRNNVQQTNRGAGYRLFASSRLGERVGRNAAAVVWDGSEALQFDRGNASDESASPARSVRWKGSVQPAAKRRGSRKRGARAPASIAVQAH